MQRLARFLACACLAVGLAGCESVNRQSVGTIAGGIVGGAIGSQIGHGQGRTIAIIGGTLLGGLAGSAVGKSMDDTDRVRMQQALEANRTNEPTAWTNPDTGAHYVVKPVRTYKRPVRHGKPQYCREFVNEAIIAGEKQQIYGKACRQPDGNWKVVQNS
jgi:surface antigen